MSKIRFASEEYVDSKLTDAATAQPDWAQNDAAASDYVKNRTHYSEEKLNILIPETSETTLGGEMFGDPTFPEPIISDYYKEYIVIVDGIKYRCMPYYDSGVAETRLGDSRLSDNMLDEIDNPEDVPFLICQWIAFEGTSYTSYQIDIYYPDDNPHTFSIAEPTGEMEYHALSEDYIPDTIARKTDLEAAINAAIGNAIGGSY